MNGPERHGSSMVPIELPAWEVVEIAKSKGLAVSVPIITWPERTVVPITIANLANAIVVHLQVRAEFGEPSIWMNSGDVAAFREMFFLEEDVEGAVG